MAYVRKVKTRRLYAEMSLDFMCETQKFYVSYCKASLLFDYSIAVCIEPLPQAPVDKLLMVSHDQSRE